MNGLGYNQRKFHGSVHFMVACITRCQITLNIWKHNIFRNMLMFSVLKITLTEPDWLT